MLNYYGREGRRHVKRDQTVKNTKDLKVHCTGIEQARGQKKEKKSLMASARESNRNFIKGTNWKIVSVFKFLVSAYTILRFLK